MMIMMMVKEDENDFSIDNGNTVTGLATIQQYKS